jgi:hypothetical protein
VSATGSAVAASAVDVARLEVSGVAATAEPEIPDTSAVTTVITASAGM